MSERERGVTGMKERGRKRMRGGGMRGSSIKKIPTSTIILLASIT